MPVGRYRHLCTVEQATETQDESGDPVIVWTSIGQFMGAIDPLRGRESIFQGQQILGEWDTRIRTRLGPLTSLITPKHRITHQGTIFNVINPAPPANLLLSKEIEIQCKSGVNDG